MVVVYLLLLAGALSPLFAQGAPPDTQPCAYFPESLLRGAFPPMAKGELKQTQRRTCSWERAGTTANDSVSINFQTNRVTPKTIDALFNRMRDGVKTEVKGRVVESKPMQVEWISGAGDKAFWNQNLQQLAVSAKDVLFYVTMPLGGMTKEQKIEAGRKVAASIIARL
jgi:hypothetical protein